MLNRLSIAQRIWLLALLSITIFSTAYLFETFQKRDDLLQAKKDRLELLVDSAHTVMVGFHQRAEAGEMTMDQARQAAKEVIRQQRYGSKGYFWINDTTPTIVMHPFKAKLEGKDMRNSTDANGKHHWREFVKVTGASGQGFVDYAYKGPQFDQPKPKISYLKAFQPWGWMVGTGVYVDDVDAEFKQQLTNNVLFLMAVLALLLGLSYLICNSIIRPMRSTSAAMHDIADGDGDLTVRMIDDGSDELSQLAAGFNGFAEKVQQTVITVSDFGRQLMQEAESMAVVTEQSKRTLDTHQEETHQVAAAVHQMSATVQEVAQNAADAASAVQAVRQRSLDGQSVVQQSVESINQLAESVDEAANSIQVLETEVQNIGGILDVIRSIADQTNLLALNAAIEAARAGEQGRGFAVVADEVRSLAQRTQESTQEIQSMIEQLQRGANNAVTIIRSGRDQAEVSVAQATTAGETLNQITEEVLLVSDMNTQIASATEEQSATVDMINQNVSNINQGFTETANGAQQIAKSGAQLKSLADQMNQLLGQFKA